MELTPGLSDAARSWTRVMLCVPGVCSIEALRSSELRGAVLGSTPPPYHEPRVLNAAPVCRCTCFHVVAHDHRWASSCSRFRCNISSSPRTTGLRCLLLAMPRGKEGEMEGERPLVFRLTRVKLKSRIWGTLQGFSLFRLGFGYARRICGVCSLSFVCVLCVFCGGSFHLCGSFVRESCMSPQRREDRSRSSYWA